MGDEKGVNITHNRGSDGFHVTTYDKGANTRESVNYTPSGGGWNVDEDSRHYTNQNYPKGNPNRH